MHGGCVGHGRRHVGRSLAVSGHTPAFSRVSVGMLIWLRLNQEVKINLDSSGTTASMVFQQGQHLWVASCGDSRVILCSRRASASGKSHWHVEPLTHDHRVTCPKEAARCGRVPVRTCQDPSSCFCNSHAVKVRWALSIARLSVLS